MKRARDEQREKCGFWWEPADDPSDHSKVPGMVFGHVRTLDTEQAKRAATNYVNASMRWGGPVAGVGGPRNIGRYTAAMPSVGTTENRLASVCSTAKAMIAVNRPNPTVLTDGAEWTKAQHARKLGKFILGLFERLELYKLGAQVADDAITFGTGCLKVWAYDGEPQAERVIIDDVIVDEQEARDGKPRQLHQRRYVDRAILQAMYPEHREAIAKASPISGRVAGGNRSTNLVEFIESWHLSSGEGMRDGKYSACIEDHCLAMEDYDHDYFPFVFYRWESPITGFYGKGLVEDLTYSQMELDEMNLYIRKCQRLVARPMIFGDFDQRLPSGFFENNIAQFFRTKGARPPTFYTPNALNAETYNERERIVQRMYDIAGVSEMSAQGKKQPGVESGVAIRAVNDIQQGRFGVQAEGYEDFYREVSRRLVWCMKDIPEAARKKVAVTFRAKRFVETIDWEAVDPKEDVFTIDIEAQSIFGRTPAGRLQAVMDLFQMGMLDKSEAMHVLDTPDLERAMDIRDAAFRYNEMAIDECLKGVYVGPEPFEDLKMCKERGQMAYLHAKLQGADKVKEGQIGLQVLQMRIDAAVTMMNEAVKAAAPPPVAPGMGAPPMGMDSGMAGMPGAPPQGMVPGAPLPGPGEPLPAM